MENFKIGIAGMSSGAGSSFVTLLLADYISGRVSGKFKDGSTCNRIKESSGDFKDAPAVTVASSGSLYFYDSLGMDRRFDKGSIIPFEEYSSYFSTQSSSQEFKVPNVDNGISWLVSSPKSIGAGISERERSRTLMRIQTQYILWDMGHRVVEKDFEEASRDIDMLIYVIDPLPSKMLPNYSCLEKVRESSLPVVYVINRMNPGVDKKDLLSFLKIKKPVYLPWVEPAVIYNSEYKCEYPYENAEIRDKLLEPVERLASIVFTLQNSLWS